MKPLSMLAVLALSSTLFAAPAAASDPVEVAEAKAADAKAIHALVSRELVQPLAAKERNGSRFTRARLPPQERRVRVLDPQPHKDAGGAAFVRFAVDARHGLIADDENDAPSWRLATITGCVYVDRSEIFVKRGDQYRPAAFLLGKNLKAAAEGTCEADQAKVARSD